MEAYRKEKFERYERGEFMTLDSLELPDSLLFQTRLLERDVYGGGGILPDVFVPLDTTYSSDTFSKILRKGLCSKYALCSGGRQPFGLGIPPCLRGRFCGQHAPSAGRRWPPWWPMSSKKMWKSTTTIGTQSLPAIELRLKAFYARNICESKSFYRVIGGLNEALQEAIRVLNDGTFNAANLAHKTF